MPSSEELIPEDIRNRAVTLFNEIVHEDDPSIPLARALMAARAHPAPTAADTGEAIETTVAERRGNRAGPKSPPTGSASSQDVATVADTGGLSAGFIDDGSLESTAVRAAVAGNHAADTGLVERLDASTRDCVTGELLFDDARPDLYVADVRELVVALSGLQADLGHAKASRLFWKDAAEEANEKRLASEQREAAAREQIAELERQRDMNAAIVECYSEEQAIVRGQLKTAEASLSSAHETIRAMREALKPFAAVIVQITEENTRAARAALTLAAKQEPRHD